MQLDLYEGFEGEPEFLFHVGEDIPVRCWEGYLAALLDELPADQAQSGLAEAWQRDLWGDEPWRVPDPAACIAQLKGITTVSEHYSHSSTEALQLRDALIALFQDAISRGETVVVERD